MLGWSFFNGLFYYEIDVWTFFFRFFRMTSTYCAHPSSPQSKNTPLYLHHCRHHVSDVNITFVRTIIVRRYKNNVYTTLITSYQIYYSQATANVRHGSELKMVNWWSAMDGLVRFPLLPPPERVYTNFEGRRFIVPVLHVSIKTKWDQDEQRKSFRTFPDINRRKQ